MSNPCLTILLSCYEILLAISVIVQWKMKPPPFTRDLKGRLFPEISTLTSWWFFGEKLILSVVNFINHLSSNSTYIREELYIRFILALKSIICSRKRVSNRTEPCGMLAFIVKRPSSILWKRCSSIISFLLRQTLIGKSWDVNLIGRVLGQTSWNAWYLVYGRYPV